MVHNHLADTQSFALIINGQQFKLTMSKVYCILGKAVHAPVEIVS